MDGIPRDPAFDSTLAFLREGYGFVSNRCDRLGSDIFLTRIMLTKAICVRGAAAAEMFYGTEHFTRNGAMPQTVLRLLQDKDSVQLLDGVAHRHRKAMFLSLLLDPSRLDRIRMLFREYWREAVRRWQREAEIDLFDEVNLILTRAACAWTGVPTDERTPDELCREFTAMLENTGSFGPGNWRALLLRRRTERFVRSLVYRVRSGRLKLSETAPLKIVASHRDENGKLLDVNSATVEIINLLRPIVAVGRYIMFVAMALQDHPEWRAKFAAGDETSLEPFAEEVRRLYPFFPIIGGRAREAFAWRGYDFREGDWVLLDLYGTDHDARRFASPHQFSPGRDISWKTQGFDFIPHGGGNAAVSHRCPGEAMTVELMKEAARLLTRDMSYEVQQQDLTLHLSRIPAKPEGGMKISHVRQCPVGGSQPDIGARGASPRGKAIGRR